MAQVLRMSSLSKEELGNKIADEIRELKLDLTRIREEGD